MVNVDGYYGAWMVFLVWQLPEDGEACEDHYGRAAGVWSSDILDIRIDQVEVLGPGVIEVLATTSSGSEVEVLAHTDGESITLVGGPLTESQQSAVLERVAEFLEDRVL